MPSICDAVGDLSLESTQKSPSDNNKITFGDLSDDILFIIATFVGVDPDLYRGFRKTPKSLYGPTAVLRLALCSSRLYKITEPVLYSRFRHIKSFAVKKDIGLQSFMRRILSRPDLASHVRKIEGSANNADVLMDMSGYRDEDWARVEAATRAASESSDEAKAWTNEIQKGAWDAINALVLSLTSNLCELNFDSWNYRNDIYPYTMRLLHRAAHLQNRSEASPLAFSKLIKVYLEYWDTRYGMKVETLVPFLEIKSVKSFRAFMVNEEYPPINPTTYPAWIASSTFATKELCLESCSLHHFYLVEFLRSFPSLERLTYLNGQAGVIDFDPPRLMVALEHLKPCLQELKIVNENVHVVKHLDGYPIGNLNGFHRLRSVDLKASMLIGTDYPSQSQFTARQSLAQSVPETLESLTLRECDRDCDKSLVTEISQLLSHKQSYAPKFTSLDLEWEKIRYPDKPSPAEPFEHRGFTKDEVIKLLAECKQAGVEMVMKMEPPKPKYVCYMKKPSGTNAMPLRCTDVFQYPYDGYEERCAEHGCDPETGVAPGLWG